MTYVLMGLLVGGLTASALAWQLPKEPPALLAVLSAIAALLWPIAVLVGSYVLLVELIHRLRRHG